MVVRIVIIGVIKDILIILNPIDISIFYTKSALVKNWILTILVLCVCTSLYITYTSSPSTKSVESLDIVDKTNLMKDPTRPQLQQRIEGRYEHEFDMTHDPNTGTVPKERLKAAREFTQLLLSRKAAIPNVNWDERGPNYVSGRTRSILIDAGDPSSNTIFSGGVSGGIWRSIDGATTWTQIDDFFDNLAIGDITQDPNNSDIIYFGTGGELLLDISDCDDSSIDD